MKLSFVNLSFRLDWIIIRRVFIRARQQFGIQLEKIDFSKPDMPNIEVKFLFLFQLNQKSIQQLGGFFMYIKN